MRALLATVAWLALAGAPAVAEQTGQHPLAGAWRMEAGPHRASGCIIRGDATITPGANGGYAVGLDVRETCPDGGVFTALERCVAGVTQPRVAIRCTVERAGASGYLADSFTLEPRGSDLMVGRLTDAGHWDEPVTWRRAAPALLS